MRAILIPSICLCFVLTGCGAVKPEGPETSSTASPVAQAPTPTVVSTPTEAETMERAVSRHDWHAALRLVEAGADVNMVLNTAFFSETPLLTAVLLGFDSDDMGLRSWQRPS